MQQGAGTHHHTGTSASPCTSGTRCRKMCYIDIMTIRRIHNGSQNHYRVVCFNTIIPYGVDLCCLIYQALAKGVVVKYWFVYDKCTPCVCLCTITYYMGSSGLRHSVVVGRHRGRSSEGSIGAIKSKIALPLRVAKNPPLAPDLYEY